MGKLIAIIFIVSGLILMISAGLAMWSNRREQVAKLTKKEREELESQRRLINKIRMETTESTVRGELAGHLINDLINAHEEERFNKWN